MPFAVNHGETNPPALPAEVWRGYVTIYGGDPGRLCAVSIDAGFPCAWTTDPAHPRLWFVPKAPQMGPIFAAWAQHERAHAERLRGVLFAALDLLPGIDEALVSECKRRGLKVPT